MPGPKRFNKDKRPKRNTQSLLFKRKRFCRFTVAGVEEIDYKDVDTPVSYTHLRAHET